MLRKGWKEMEQQFFLNPGVARKQEKTDTDRSIKASRWSECPNRLWQKAQLVENWPLSQDWETAHGHWWRPRRGSRFASVTLTGLQSFPRPALGSLGDHDPKFLLDDDILKLHKFCAYHRKISDIQGSVQNRSWCWASATGPAGLPSRLLGRCTGLLWESNAVHFLYLNSSPSPQMDVDPGLDFLPCFKELITRTHFHF